MIKNLLIGILGITAFAVCFNSLLRSEKHKTSVQDNPRPTPSTIEPKTNQAERRTETGFSPKTNSNLSPQNDIKQEIKESVILPSANTGSSAEISHKASAHRLEMREGSSYRPIASERSREVVSNKRTWTVSDQFTAIPGTVTASLESGINFPGFTIVPLADKPSLNTGLTSNQIIHDPDSRTVVKNNENGRIGVVSGNLVVKTKPGADTHNLALVHGLYLKGAFSRINTAIFQAPSGANLIDINEKLRRDPQIESSEIEILTGDIAPR